MGKNKNKTEGEGGGRTTPPGQPPGMRFADPARLADYWRQKALQLTNDVGNLQAIILEDADKIKNLEGQVARLTERTADLLNPGRKKDGNKEEAGSEGSEPTADTPGRPSGAQSSPESGGSGKSNGRRASSGKRS